jgi:hypothetical protein
LTGNVNAVPSPNCSAVFSTTELAGAASSVVAFTPVTPFSNVTSHVIRRMMLLTSLHFHQTDED